MTTFLRACVGRLRRKVRSPCTSLTGADTGSRGMERPSSYTSSLAPTPFTGGASLPQQEGTRGMVATLPLFGGGSQISQILFHWFIIDRVCYPIMHLQNGFHLLLSFSPTVISNREGCHQFHPLFHPLFHQFPSKTPCLKLQGFRFNGAVWVCGLNVLGFVFGLVFVVPSSHLLRFLTPAPFREAGRPSPIPFTFTNTI